MAVQVKNSVIKNVGTVPVIVSETDASKRQTILGLSITNLTDGFLYICLLYTSPSPRDRTRSRMPSSA